MFIRLTSASIFTLLALYLLKIILEKNSIPITSEAVISICVSCFIIINGLINYFATHGIKSSLKHFFIWISLFFLCITGYAFRWELDDGYKRVLGTIMPSYSWSDAKGEKLIISRNGDGHFYLNAYVNNIKIKFMVDTGASDVALTKADIKALGINLAELKFNEQYLTANGSVQGATIPLKTIKIGGKIISNVKGHYGSGELDVSLLGMSVIERFKSFTIDKDKLYLEY